MDCFVLEIFNFGGKSLLFYWVGGDTIRYLFFNASTFWKKSLSFLLLFHLHNINISLLVSYFFSCHSQKILGDTSPHNLLRG